MKSTRAMAMAMAMVMLVALTGCSMNGSTPLTAWGKKDISMLDYRTDAGQCALIAVTLSTEENGANTAGGISGQNATVPQQGPSGSGVSAGNIPGTSPNPTPTPRSTSGNTYRESASADFVNRAVQQQRSQEMAAQRARNDALKSCLSNRGYTEFELTPEQRATLSKLPQGSDERREYLYKLGTDAQVLDGQAVARKRQGS
jgi:hypothetical protein